MPVQYIANKAFVIRGGKVLIIREAPSHPEGTNAGKWDVPGGRMDFGELPEEALLREVKEETGLEVTIDRPFAVGQWQPVIKGEPTQIVGVYYRCEAEPGAVRLSREHDEAIWIDPKEYRNHDLVPNVSPIFEEYLRQFGES